MSVFLAILSVNIPLDLHQEFNKLLIQIFKSWNSQKNRNYFKK